MTCHGTWLISDKILLRSSKEVIFGNFNGNKRALSVNSGKVLVGAVGQLGVSSPKPFHPLATYAASE
jgi:hypothetical protein